MVMINEMVAAKEYVERVYFQLEKRCSDEQAFLQAAQEVLYTLIPFFEKNPQWIDSGILERLVEPDRMIIFRVPWVDDEGNVIVNRGFRVQFNNAIGPYKGGLRFHPSVDLSIIKFLGFEQIFKNALTGLPIGGAKGGADFNPKGRSNGEVMRFCQSFMSELHKHIGHDADVPAGDIGVGEREIGYLFGQYKKIKSSFNAGTLTGKGLTYGGSHIRKEATGYGLVYFLKEMLEDNGYNIKGMKAIVSGSGNVAIYAIEKLNHFGVKVVACSDSKGVIHDPYGIDIELVKKIKEVERGSLASYITQHPDAVYVKNSDSIWSVSCDIALPCATQNELGHSGAKKLIANGCIAIAEGANMPTSKEALDTILDNKMLFGPAKAANAGGVAVSALEMSQNSMRYTWSVDEVDAKLQDIMNRIYLSCRDTAIKYGAPNNLLLGANITGFEKVARSMEAHGVV